MSEFADGPAWLACVLDRSGNPIGAGVVVDDQHIITCAHLIDPEQPIWLRFPFLQGAQATATVVAGGWHEVDENGSGDLAVLRLDQWATTVLVPAPLAIPCDFNDRRAYIRGFPRGQRAGAIALGTLRGRSGPRGEWVQIDPHSEGWPIEKGFSGGPVWDKTTQAVVGLVVARDAHGTGHLLPLEYLGTLWPPLLDKAIWETEAATTDSSPASASMGSVNVGNVYGNVTTNVFGPGREHLADVSLDPSPLLEASDVDRFTGREWLLEAFDQFTKRNRSGYFLVESEAGIGKTAFAAWLSRERGYISHFSGAEGARTAVSMRKNLAAQLIRRWGLGEFAPDGYLPAAAARRDWFAQVLTTASKTEHLGPIVLVLDGLDEVRGAELDDGVGLPSQLPDGVFILVTCRAGNVLDPSWRPFNLHTIEPVAANNLEDMWAHLHTVAREPLIASKLDTAGMHTEQFCGLLLNRCGGVWIYLRFVLDEIRQGLRSVSDIVSLPGDLWSYYTQNLSRMRADQDAWDNCYLPVLATLAAISEPLPVTLIGQLARVPSVSRVQQFLGETFRPFCRVIATGDGPRYQLYHASLREFLLGVPADGERPSSGSLPQQLKLAVHAAHSNIIERYFEAWGGLQRGLPHLAASPEPGLMDGGYGVRRIVDHLEATRRISEIHRLLECQRFIQQGTRGHRTSQQLWFAIHDFMGDHDGYLADIDRARSWALHAAGLRDHHQATYIGLAVLYALILATFNSITESISHQFAALLLRAGIWKPGQAFAYASRVASPTGQALALHRISQVLSEPERDQALSMALKIAIKAVPGPDQTTALLLITESLDEAAIERIAIPFAVSYEDSGHKIALLDTMLACLPHARQERVAESLFESAMNKLQSSVAVLVAVAPYLTDSSAEAAGAAVLRVGSDSAKVAMAVALCGRLNTEAEREQIALSAIMVARSKADKSQATELLLAMAGRSPELTFRAIANGASRLEQHPAWSIVVQQTAIRLPEKDLAFALQSMFSKRGTPQWISTLERLAPKLDPATLPILLAKGEDLDPTLRTQALMSIVHHLRLQPAFEMQTAESAQSSAVLKLLGRSKLSPRQIESVRAVLTSTSVVGDWRMVQHTCAKLESVLAESRWEQAQALQDLFWFSDLINTMAASGRPAAIGYLEREAKTFGSTHAAAVHAVMRAIRQVGAWWP